MLTRNRNYATLLYSDSAKEEWVNILEQQHIPALISPKHDRDVDEKNKPKKEHYHVLLLFEGCKTAEQAKEIFNMIGGVGVESVKSVRSYSRYLCHLDNPEKAQYDTNEVIALSGADYSSMITLPSSKYEAIGEMIDFCMANDIISYAALLLYAKKNRRDWFRILCDSATITIVQFLKSRTWEMKTNDRRL